MKIIIIPFFIIGLIISLYDKGYFFRGSNLILFYFEKITEGDFLKT
jgi:hypothetical protein